MSTLPVSDPYDIAKNSEFLGSLDNSWSHYQEILHSGAPAQSNINEATTDSAARILDIHGLELTKIRSHNSKIRKKRINNRDTAMEQSVEEGQSSVAKKLDHNAKERIRRMKLNASYLALRALLPDSRRSKKRWSAPAIVDRVLKYIPEREHEVESLRSHKENLQSEAKNKKFANDKKPRSEYQSRTVSLNQVNEEEAIIHICMAREDELECKFMNLLQSIEDEDICIKSASAIYICDSRICYHLHIQISTSEADYYIEELRDKVISWLR